MKPGNKGEGAGQGCVFTVKQAGGIATRKGGMNEERGEIGRRCTKGIIVNAKPEPWPAGLQTLPRKRISSGNE